MFTVTMMYWSIVVVVCNETTKPLETCIHELNFCRVFLGNSESYV